MSKKYIIGIDGGSQSTKVVMYDLEGNVVCEGKGLLQPMHTPDADTAEHPDDDLWASLCFAGHDLMSQFAGNKEDIVGIGLGSIRCCRALLKADGTPAAPLISWQDARVTRPYEHTNPDVAYVTSFSGYLTHRLTGEFKDNIANYFGQWPVDYKSWAWSEDAAVMDKFNIPRHMLFDVQMPGTVLGHITPQAALATHFPAENRQNYLCRIKRASYNESQDRLLVYALHHFGMMCMLKYKRTPECLPQTGYAIEGLRGTSGPGTPLPSLRNFFSP